MLQRQAQKQERALPHTFHFPDEVLNLKCEISGFVHNLSNSMPVLLEAQFTNPTLTDFLRFQALTD